MKVVLQRVKWGKVSVNEKVVGEIGEGIVALLGIKQGDTDKDCDYLIDKISNARIFADNDGHFNSSLLDTGRELLVVSQFTLYGDMKKGRRPNFSAAAPPQDAKNMYNAFVQKCRDRGIKTSEGQFQAMMQVELCNDGPVTLILESN